jgi:glucose-6-phosphate 1-dehydrogenase
MQIESQLIVIFGGTGDLARRKLIPALARLRQQEKIPSDTPIVCLGRAVLNQAEFVEHLRQDSSARADERDLLSILSGSLHYHRFDLAEGTSDQLRTILEPIAHSCDCSGNILFYLALPTSVFSRAAQLIQPLLDAPGWKRVVFEKPFGQDLNSARQLNESIGSVLREDQIYRVDHYLGKELVQNVLYLRFANEIFSCSWNREAIDHVQITVSESLGVEERAGYYDQSGAIRDMVQNHLLQLLSFIAMEEPASGHGDDIREEAARVMQHLRPPGSGDVVVGQYLAGEAGGATLAAYRDEEDVPPDSTTETFVALRAFLDTERWQGVPFYLRTGKRLSQRYAEIRVVFKHHLLDGLTARNKPNSIVIRIQPDEGIALAFNVRKPGSFHESESVLMDFCHHCHFGPNTPEAYETILASVMQGDPLLFTRWDWLEASWKFIDRLKAAVPRLSFYRAGSAGPEAAERLLEADGKSWARPEPPGLPRYNQ